LASVQLAFNDVGLAVQLQESLGTAGYDVRWEAATAGGPAEDGASLPDVVLLADDDSGLPIEMMVKGWRDALPPPGILVLVSKEEDRNAALRARAAFLPASAAHSELTAAIAQVAKLRFACGLEAEAPMKVALHSLGLQPRDNDEENALCVVAGATNADIDTVREALRWHAQDYVTADPNQVEVLRAHRALQIPEVEFVNLLDGTKTLQTVVRSNAIDGWHAARMVWALASVGTVAFTPEPPDLATGGRRALVEARYHLRARRARLQHATLFDVLEVIPEARPEELERAYKMLALRYAPNRLEAMDLGNAAQLVKATWDEVTQAYTTLAKWGDRKRYSEWVAAQGGKLQSHWMVRADDARRAADNLALGQKALLEGNVFKAVSDMAAACRLHQQHPAFEASLCWARYRAEVSSGKDRDAVAKRERAIAERALAGCRPWSRALLALGLLCTAGGDPEAARWHLREALTVDPNLPAAKQILARLRAGSTLSA